MTTPPIDYSRKWYVMAAMGVGSLLETIDSSSITLALPTLVDTFRIDFALVQWVVLASVLTQSALMLVMGRLGDTLGKKRIFVAGFVVAGIGAVCAGLSPTISWLIAFRVVQAVGIAMSMALMMGIATEAFPPSERGKALGVIGALVSLGIIIGPLLGGYILDYFSWRWLFFINIPIVLLGIPLSLRYLPDVRPGGRQPFDYAGAALFFVALFALLLSTTYGQQDGYGQPLVLLLLGLSALFFTLFVLVERRHSHPVVDLRLFRMRRFSVNVVLRFISFVVYTGAGLLLPFFLKNVLHYAPGEMGLILTAMPLFFGLTAPFAGTLADRFGTRPLAVTGLVLLLIGCVALSTLNAETTTLGLLARMIPLGAGLGVFQSPNNSVIMGATPPERLGMTSSLTSVVRTVGRSTGIAIIGAFWVSQVLFHAGAGFLDATRTPVAAQVAGTRQAFWLAAGFVVLALLLSGWDWLRERQELQGRPLAAQSRG
ncbi:MAG: DHA2 family efflux MFS transporter permease subunit [Chloroflexi bacterium]|nr:MAG: DHA2 family efflux MFS transporter permease subunit [Chloroflexota bacterium]